MHPATLDECIANGRTDLIIAWAMSGPLGPEASWPKVEGHSLLQWMAYFGDVSGLRVLVHQGADLRGLGPDLGLTAGAFHGHWRLCEYLLEHGADVDHRDEATGETALHAALVHSDRPCGDRVVAVLLRWGASPHATTTPGVPTGSFMRDARTRGESPLHRAAAFGSVATIQQLLDVGADPAMRDHHDDTPLAWASWYRRPPEVLRRLLHGGHTLNPAYRPMRETLLGTPLSHGVVSNEADRPGPPSDQQAYSP